MKFTVKTNLHKGHRKRLINFYYSFGIDALYDHQILELMLYYIIPRADTNPTAHRLLLEHGTIENVFNTDANQLMAISGVGIKTATFLNQLGELFHSLKFDIAFASINSYEEYIKLCSMCVSGTNVGVALICDGAMVCGILPLESDPSIDWKINYNKLLFCLRSKAISYLLVGKDLKNYDIVFDYYIKIFNSFELECCDVILFDDDKMFKVLENGPQSVFNVTLGKICEYSTRFYTLARTHFDEQKLDASDEHDHIYTF